MGKDDIEGSRVVIEVNVDKDCHLIWQLIEQVNVLAEYSSLYDKNYQPENFIKIKISTDGIPCFHWSEYEKINACKHNVIFVDILTEGMYHSIIELINTQYDKNKKYFLFSNGKCNVDVIDLSIDYTLITYNYHWVDWVVRGMQPWHINFYNTKQYQPELIKSNEFACIIGSKRPRRTELVHKLSSLPFDNYILNYAGVDLKVPSQHLNINYDFQNYNSYIDFGLVTPFNIAQSVPIDILNTARYNLIVETDCDSPGWHLTEKTLKAISIGIPWIIFSSQHFLKYLHSLGFMSYDTLWDEGYDDVADTSERINKIFDLVTLLKKFDWAGYSEQLHIIAEHNRKNLFTNHRHIITNQLKYFNSKMIKLEKQIKV